MIDGLIIDSFAGGGGASTGIEWALGRSPDFAIDHDPEALAMHEANHPETVHLTENIWKINPQALVRGRKVALLWASPDCRHHSKAKGGAPVSRSVRGLADVILVWGREVRPDVISLENVEEFADWGPLGEDGRPCPQRKGQDFKRWVRALEAMGYEVQYRELRACDYGAPTIRKRLFLVARCDGKPILWPAPTHGDPKSEAVQSGKLKPWRTAAEIIDWSIKCPSIFLTRDQARDEGLKVVRPLAPKTMSRIARGFKRYVLDRAEPFIVVGNHAGDGFRGQGLDRPFATVTRARDAFGLIAPFVSYAQQGGANRPSDAPMHTICASTKDQNQVVVPYLAGVGGRMGQSGERPTDKPYHTVTTKPDTVVAAPLLMTMRNSGKPWTAPDEPSHTITAGGAGLSIVSPYLAQHNTGVLGRAADDPAATVTTSGAQVQPVFGYLVSRYGEREGQLPRCRSINDPYATVVQHGNGGDLVFPYMSIYYGTGEGAGCDDPLRTATTRDRFALVDCAGLAPPFDEAKAASARQVAAFLRAEGVWDGPGEFVTVGPFIVYDIGMRMLTARELARAQGFPESYILAAPLDGGGTLTDTAQRHKIGNSVSPYPAAALLRENMITAMSMPTVRRKRMAFDDLPAPPPVPGPAELFEAE